MFHLLHLFLSVIRICTRISLAEHPGTRATVTGKRAKTVKCEKCQYGYVYSVARKATGPLSSATGKQYETVDHRVDVLLTNAIEPVPCPSCGWMQANMIPVAKARYRSWMTTLGGGTLAVAGMGMLLAFAALADRTSVAGSWGMAFSLAILVVSLGLYAGRAYLVSRFDPNSISPELQKVVGQRASITREDYEKAQGEVQLTTLDRREQAKRNMARGYGLPDATDELTDCLYCGHRQIAKNKKCVSCKRTLSKG